MSEADEDKGMHRMSSSRDDILFFFFGFGAGGFFPNYGFCPGAFCENCIKKVGRRREQGYNGAVWFTFWCPEFVTVGTTLT